MKTSGRFLQLSFAFAVLVAGLCAKADAPNETPPASASEMVVSTGWKFQPQDPGGVLKRAHQIGLLNETSEKPVFTSVPVLLIPAPGLLKRSQTAQLARLAKEVAGIVNPPSAQHDHTSKKITDGQPRVEAQYGKLGKGFTWAYASILGENILVMMTQSRELKPPSFARDEFFRMARAFKPGTSLIASATAEAAAAATLPAVPATTPASTPVP
jgi:hypothetical protein